MTNITIRKNAKTEFFYNINYSNLQQQSTINLHEAVIFKNRAQSRIIKRIGT